MDGTQAIWELGPLLIAMAGLLAISAFFSASEAALFSLRAPDRQRLRQGNTREQLAYRLLSDPDRLLSAVLFWNLVVNIGYFALVSLVGLRLQQLPGVGKTLLATVTGAMLLTIIFFSEMLPKSIAVLTARRLAAWVSVPLAFGVRIVDPLLPAFRVVNLLSRRLIWPTFRSEPYLQVTDLARAIELSTDDAQLIAQEQRVLQNVISLSDLRVDECMRPRSKLAMFRPPLHWQERAMDLRDLNDVYITEHDSDEIVAVLDLRELWDVPEQHLERLAEEVLYAPWCAKVADVFQDLEASDRAAVVVVNERGETIGAITRGDILEIAFSSRSSRSERLLKREPIARLDDDLWQVTGMTNLRALAEHFGWELPATGSVTVAGVLQEELQRIPQLGDHVEWGPFVFDVTETPEQEPMVVQLQRRQVPDQEE